MNKLFRLLSHFWLCLCFFWLCLFESFVYLCLHEQQWNCCGYIIRKIFCRSHLLDFVQIHYRTKYIYEQFTGMVVVFIDSLKITCLKTKNFSQLFITSFLFFLL